MVRRVEWLAHRAGVVEFGARTGLAAALYAGYPVWAFRLAGELSRRPSR